MQQATTQTSQAPAPFTCPFDEADQNAERIARQMEERGDLYTDYLPFGFVYPNTFSVNVLDARNHLVAVGHSVKSYEAAERVGLETARLYASYAQTQSALVEAIWGVA